MVRSLSIFIHWLPQIACPSTGGGDDVETSLQIVGAGGETDLQASFSKPPRQRIRRSP
jgi:hypothetical protein